ncbi:hypothetical protein BCV70DRAFT_201787 [Testicularia cyperi]|uniref:SET domain-containing protein n=1 Tax=Testicularia cyperi TaxID=1882483 RepID=A0A317XKT3_9BASI|nr:hypothetical protein BCV70DRAFT_201787 [Testicularia cyperi]
MEDLLKALRNIGLALPDHEQLLQLSDPDPEVQENLARHLALNPAKNDLESDKNVEEAQSNHEDEEEDDDLGVDPLMDADLFKGAVQALLENYNKFIDKERDALRKEADLFSAPKRVKPVPLKALLARQAAEIKKRQEEVYTAGYDPESGRKRRRFYLPRQTFDGVGSYASSKPLSQLTRVDFDQFEAPKCLEGRYVLCKVASSLNLYVAGSFIALLPSGQAIPVSIAHFTSNLHLSGQDLDSCLPVGTVLALKEPFVSLNHFGKGGHAQGGKSVTGIRIDTPTDVCIVDGIGKEDALLTKDVQWKVEVPGFEAGQHFEDVAALLQDLPQTVNSRGCRWLQDGPLSRICLRRLQEPSFARPQFEQAKTETRAEWRKRTRSLVESLLSDNRPGAAHRELIAARQLGVTGQDEFARGQDLELEGRVLYRMCKFGESRAVLEAALQAYPPEQRMQAQERILDLLNTVRMAQKASSEGPSHENVWGYYFDSQSYATPRFDVQDWFGPVSIQDIPGAGRGLVLTRDVDEGELLLCCKAAASSYAADPGCRGIHLLRYTVETGVTSTTTQVLAATKSIHAMIDRPQDLTLPIMGLTAGPDVPYSAWVGLPYPAPPKRTFVDTPKDQIDAIARAFSRKLDLSVEDEPAKRDRRALLDGSVRASIDSSYVDGVLRFNAFGPAANPGGKSSSTDADDASASAASASELSRSTMVHPLPAILNHACLPNVSSVFFGDIVTTRALHPLKKGTEIMHQYVKGEQPWLIRRSQLSKHGFKCSCGICQLDERDGEEQVRQRHQIVGGSFSMLQERSRIVLKSTEENKDDHEDLADSLLQLIEKLQATYDAHRPILRPDLMRIYQTLALHQSRYDLDAAVASELKALESIGCTLSRAKASQSDSPRTRILAELPSLHFDGGITSMLTLAKFMLAQTPADETAARRWIEQAFYTHQCTIGGGLDIFLDRWHDAFTDLPFRQWLPRC